MEPARLYCTDTLRAIDRQAQQLPGVDAHVLMQRAAHAAWQAARRRWPDARHITVLCGPGNNGGDGWILAGLASADGCAVRIHAAPPHDRASAAARRARAECSLPVAPLDTLDAAVQGQLPDLVVDALFGIGLTRPLQGDVAHAVERVNRAAVPVLSLDVPSGVDADSGHVAGPAIRAAATISFLAGKRGLHTGAALDHVGEVEYHRLGVPVQDLPGAEAGLWLPALLRFGRRDRDSHKGSHGHVLAIGGDHGMAGAIGLCAMAALRTGAGKVSVLSRAAHAALLTGLQPELMVHDDQALSLLEDADVVVVGPGLGTGSWGRGLLQHALACGKPLVLDADALNLLQQSHRLPAGTVLTPHPGEAARLLGCATASVQANRFAAAASLVARHGATVVLKGAGTVIASPGRTDAVIAAGNPGMASGGMGDLLAGVIAALLAQGHDGFGGAAMGALLHGCAGDAAALQGERGMLASDLLAPLRQLANR